MEAFFKKLLINLSDKSILKLLCSILLSKFYPWLKYSLHFKHFLFLCCENKCCNLEDLQISKHIWNIIMFTAMGSFQLPNSLNQTYHAQYPGIFSWTYFGCTGKYYYLPKGFHRWHDKTSTIQHKSFFILDIYHVIY